MDEQRVTLWCKVLGRLVEVVLVKGRSLQPPIPPPAFPAEGGPFEERRPFEPKSGGGTIPGVPDGWVVCECVEKDTECFGKGCPFTMDGGEVPFGEVGELSDGSSESFDPLADPSFEGEWD